MPDETHISTSVEDTWRIAATLADNLPRRAVLALHGNLGSGKTCFIQGLALALDIDQPVVSPTFTVAREYHGKTSLFHLDLYRITNPDEILNFGFEEYLASDGIVAVEWAEHAGDIIPADAIHILFEPTDKTEERRITIKRS